MRTVFLSAFAIILLTACNQSSGPSEVKKAENTTTSTTATDTESQESARTNSQVTPGTYMCWQNDQASMAGRTLLGELTIKGNTYSGDLYGKGSYAFDPATKIVTFDGGGFDQRKNGKEWIGIFYNKGEKFIDGSGGKAANTMLIITSLEDWNKGYKKAWIQQCDLK